MGSDRQEVRYEYAVEPLTAKQRQVLDVIEQHVRQHGTSPTYGDLCVPLRVSRSTVVEHIRKLDDKGYLSRVRGKHRAIVLTDPHTGLALRRDTARALPVVHSINPTFTLASDLDVRGHLVVPDHLLERPDEPAFLLRVNSDSMASAGLLRDGLAVVASRSTARSGQIVVALISTETRPDVPVIARYRSLRGGPVELIFEAGHRHHVMRPLTCSIIGVITGAMRRFEDPPDQ
jgi:repressor LexA